MATTSPLIQIPLLKPNLGDVLPTDTGRYVAALQNRSGELNALSNVSDAAWGRLTPMITIVGPKTPKAVLTPTSVAAWVKRLCDAVGMHAFYLDIARLGPSHPAGDDTAVMPVLAMIYQEVRKRHMHFVPVICAGESPPDHVSLVADAVLEDAFGVAVRYRVRDFSPPPGTSREDFLKAQLAAVSCSVADSDLIVDLGYLDGETEVDPDDITTLLEELCAVGAWRSLVLIGTSIPKMMTEVTQGTVGSSPRREWELWSKLREHKVVRVPAFGDYAVQHPDPPLDVGGGNTMRANIRYTVAGQTLVARGVGPVTVEGKEQYQDLCQWLVQRPEFAGSDYSWGDSVIVECASGSIEPGAQPTWRGAGTSHHLQVVTDRLGELQASSRSGASGSSPGRRSG